MRKLVVGDIHGGLRPLISVLNFCKYDYKEDQLIFLGDYVDGWSESAELIQYLIELEKKAVNKPIFLRGNHDEWAAQWIVYGQPPNGWMEQGGAATYDSYIRTGYLMNEEHKDFFRNLHNYYIDDKNRGFVHGGFKSKLGLGNDHYVSDYYWDRDLWELAMALDGKIPDESDPDYDQYYRPNPYRMYKHEEVFIGHTTTCMWKVKPSYREYKDANQAPNGSITVPMKRCNMWNLDTGGGWSGKLTIMDIDTKEYWQSEKVSELYPDEKGR